MRTKIHTTKKLERLIKKLISTDEKTEGGILGKWNATVFYVTRKKCWLVTNGLTKYNVILTDIKASDLKNINQIFKNALYQQLTYDGVKTKPKDIYLIIGKLNFHPTDNDRSATAFQNQRLQDFDWWKYDFASLEDMPIRELTNRMNTSPIHIGKGRKISDYTDSVKEMKKTIYFKSFSEE